MIRLSKPQVLLLHKQLIAETKGSSVLRDEGLLDSALNAPFQTFEGEEVYPSLQQKAARLCFGLTVYANRIIRCYPAISSRYHSIFRFTKLDTYTSDLKIFLLTFLN